MIRRGLLIGSGGNGELIWSGELTNNYSVDINYTNIEVGDTLGFEFTLKKEFPIKMGQTLFTIRIGNGARDQFSLYSDTKYYCFGRADNGSILSKTLNVGDKIIIYLTFMENYTINYACDKNDEESVSGNASIPFRQLYGIIGKHEYIQNIKVVKYKTS